MSALLILAGARAARGAARPGATVVAWDAEARDALERKGAAFRTLDELLGAAGVEAVEEAAIRWTKDLGRRPVRDGRTLREVAAWKGVSLWWFAELYLHHSTRATRLVRVVETMARVLDALAPEEVECRGLPPEEALLVERTCTVRGVLYDGARGTARGGTARARAVAGRWNELKAVGATAKAALGGRPQAPDGRPTALFLSHAAFWRTREDGPYEHYFDRLIPEIAARGRLSPFVVAVGPRAAFRRRGRRQQFAEWLGRGGGEPFEHVNRYLDRRVLAEIRRGAALARQTWRDLSDAAALRDALVHRGVRLGDLAHDGLAATFHLQLPWAVRSYEEMAAVLRAVRPAVVCLYAESSGWGRAAIAACRAAGVPTVAVQHGILYPTYFSYRHDADERACPIPDRTAVFGDAARRFLVEHGGYPAETLVTTGSPRFDQLVGQTARLDREGLRREHGVREGEPLLVVASRFRGIRETHRSIGRAFPALVAAVEALGARALVKPHPAEPAAAYEAVVRGAGSTRVRVLSPSAELAPLLVAADALVTVESLSAVEALVLGRPVVVLDTPTNLQALVEQGVALGVPAGADPQDVLRRAVADPATRAALRAAREAYLSDVAMGADGQATARIAALLERTAGVFPADVVPAPGMVG